MDTVLIGVTQVTIKEHLCYRYPVDSHLSETTAKRALVHHQGGCFNPLSANGNAICDIHLSEEEEERRKLLY